jgi:hypothetical protein
MKMCKVLWHLTILKPVLAYLKDLSEREFERCLSTVFDLSVFYIPCLSGFAIFLIDN